VNIKVCLVILLVLGIVAGCLSVPSTTSRPAGVTNNKADRSAVSKETPKSSEPAKPHGIYVYSEKMAKFEDDLAQSLKVPGVDGLTLLIGWNAIEPEKDTYDWTEIDKWMNAVVLSGKNVILAIRAGQDTPEWLFQGGRSSREKTKAYGGATPLQFQNVAREGIGQTAENVNTIIISAPWDPIFLKEWDSLLAHISQHLKSAGTYDALVSLRLTGINRTTCELRLPAEILTQPTKINCVKTWLEATPPYRPARLLKAWDDLTDSFQRNFPDKYFGVEIIPVASGGGKEYPFPAIDDNGCVYQPPWPKELSEPNFTERSDLNLTASICINKADVPDQNEPLLRLVSQKFAGRLSVSYQNLDIRLPADPYPVYAARTWGTDIGYQVNDYDSFERSACGGTFLKPEPCESTSYLKLLEVGIFPLGQEDHSLRAQYIEVLPPDAIKFTHAIEKAHNELFSQP